MSYLLKIWSVSRGFCCTSYTWEVICLDLQNIFYHNHDHVKLWSDRWKEFLLKLLYFNWVFLHSVETLHKTNQASPQSSVCVCVIAEVTAVCFWSGLCLEEVVWYLQFAGFKLFGCLCGFIISLNLWSCCAFCLFVFLSFIISFIFLTCYLCPFSYLFLTVCILKKKIMQ